MKQEFIDNFNGLTLMRVTKIKAQNILRDGKGIFIKNDRNGYRYAWEYYSNDFEYFNRYNNDIRSDYRPLEMEGKYYMPVISVNKNTGSPCDPRCHNAKWVYDCFHLERFNYYVDSLIID